MITDTNTNTEKSAAFDPVEREKQLNEYLPEVRYIARRIHERLPVQVPLEDLIHAGVLGLIDAVDRFDPGKHTQLKTYAKFRIRGAILDSLRANDWSPRSLRRRARLVEEAHRSLSMELGRSPSESELAERISMDLSGFQQLLGELNGLNLGSLQWRGAGDSGDDKEDVYAYRPNGPDEDPFFLCWRSELKSFLQEALNDLNEKERRVITLYYLEELNMKEVGAVLGVGESRASQIHSMAIVRLRTKVQQFLAQRSSGSAPEAAPMENET